MALWASIVHDPAPIASQYEEMWLRERRNPIGAYYEIRAEFNRDRDPALANITSCARRMIVTGLIDFFCSYDAILCDPVQNKSCALVGDGFNSFQDFVRNLGHTGSER